MRTRIALPLLVLVVVSLMGCYPASITPSPTPTLTPVPTPTATPASAPSPTPTIDRAAVMKEVKGYLTQAVSSESAGDFQAAQGSAFQALALYLSLPEVQEMSEEEIEETLLSLGQEAGVEMWVTGVDIMRVEPNLYLVKFGTYPIALFWGEERPPFDYYPVAEGDAIFDARLVGEEMGIIFAYIGASTVTPDYLLLRRERGWEKVWPRDPEPYRDLWITADGELSFAADDLSLLRMEGSSWGVFSEEDPFFECHACAHRFFDLLWVRDGDEYLPRVTLPPEAPYYDRLWEITQPSPYASLFEFIRCLRAGDEEGALELTSGPSMVDQAKALGLQDPVVTYLAEGEPGQGEGEVLFSREDLTVSFVATLEQPGGGEHWILTNLAKKE